MSGIDHAQYYRAAVRMAANQPLYIAPTGDIYADANPYSPWPAISLRLTADLTQRESFRVWIAACLLLLSFSALWLGVPLGTSIEAKPIYCSFFLIISHGNWVTVCELLLGDVQSAPLTPLVAMFHERLAKPVR